MTPHPQATKSQMQIALRWVYKTWEVESLYQYMSILINKLFLIVLLYGR
jgi:hypothetical protein